jgi:hypothetical protein
MRSSSSSRLRGLFLAFLLVALAGAQVAGAASLTVFEGNYGGKYTGVLTIAQGSATRLIGSANTKVSASRKAGKFTIKGTLNSTGFVQTISLGSNGRAQLSSVLPGGTGSFQASASGSYTVHGKAVKITISNPGGLRGSMTMTINFINAGSTLCISSVVTPNGSDPIFTTVIGS